MKRALLIAGGTVGGLGAVLAITPPQFNQTTNVGALSGSLGTPAVGGKTTAVATHASTPAATKSATSKATSKAKASAAASSSASATQTQAATPAPTATKTTVAPASTGYSGTVTGATFAARNYGNLSATVTFSNGQISRVSASQSPSSWSQNSLPTLIPYASSGKITVEQIKTFAAEQLPCAISNSCRSQASFTATAFWQSVKSAISKAGL
ncbi:hypothetical protein MCERH3_00061 [Candidatus Nanopelagicaceae bacterium]